MLVLVDKYVLRFDVSMSNGDHGEIVEASEQLVGVDLDQERVHLLLLDHLVQVVREVVRDDVEVLHLAFVGQEAVLHQQVVRMFQHLQDLELPVLVFLVLQHLLNGYLLACCSVCPEIDHSKGALPCHPLNLILAHHGTRLGFLGNGDTGFTKLIGFSFEMFVVVAGLGGVYFEVAAGRVGLLGHVLGVDVDEFGLGMQFLCFLELVPEGVGFIDFGDHPAVHLLVRTALLVLRLIVIKQHARWLWSNYRQLRIEDQQSGEQGRGKQGSREKAADNQGGRESKGQTRRTGQTTGKGQNRRHFLGKSATVNNSRNREPAFDPCL